MSHTKELIEKALDELEKYLEEKHLTEDIEVAKYGASVKRTGINRYFNKLGIQVVRVREWRYAQKFSANYYFGKLSSVQFLRFATSNPERFDEIYNLLADEASKASFDWYVKYRTAYAFIGEEAYELFTPEITREAWEDMEKRIRKSANRVYEFDEFTIEGTAGDLVLSFIVQQYRYDSIVEPKLGDVVFDIGALWAIQLSGFPKLLVLKVRFMPLNQNQATLRSSRPILSEIRLLT